MNKLQMAHEMALAIQGTKLIHDMELVSDMAWKYADAMQAEADKRVVKFSDVFFDTKQNEEWQPDWSQAPAWANYIAVYSDCCNASYFEKEPKIISGYTWGGTDGKSLLTPIPVYTGNWQNSLRKRPFKKEPIIDWSNVPKDAIAYKIVDGIVQYLHGTRSSDGTLCGGYLASDGWIKLEKRP